MKKSSVQNRDFTLSVFQKLLITFIDNGFRIICFKEYLKDKNIDSPLLIIRHDVDRCPKNALKLARIEFELGVHATYYFRIKKRSYNSEIIQEIIRYGHEIGYHYEDLSSCNGDHKKAIYTFEKNLEKLKNLYPIKTICMHGSPLSRWNNHSLWDHYDYKDFGIIGDTYFDVDYSVVNYLTDTGRRWNDFLVCIRDKVVDIDCKWSDVQYGSTYEIIKSIETNQFANKAMITIHPQRWNDQPILWLKELVFQELKNPLKIVYNSLIN